MKHYFVADTEKHLGDMIIEFLFAYQISKVIKIEDLGKTNDGKNYSICIEFEDGYGEFDPKSDGQIHYYNGDLMDEIKHVRDRHVNKNGN